MEGADEELKSSQYSSEAKVSCVLNRGLRLGRQILLAGFLASSAPIVLPPLVVVSAIGISVSVPYGLLLASRASTEKFMSILLPMPTPPAPLLNSNVEGEERQDRKEGYSEEYKEEQLQMQEKKTRRGIEVVDVSEEDHNMALWNDDEQGVVQKDEPELLQDATDVIEDRGSGSEEDYSEEEKASPEELLMGGQCHGVVITVEGLEKIGDEIEEYEAPFEVTNVDFEELGDEGHIREAELEKETKGVLEKIRDEGKSDTTKEEYVNGIRGVNMEMRESGDEKSRDPEESSNATVPVELADSYVQHSSTQSEYSSGNNEVMLNEEKIWKEIHAIRSIVGYQGRPQASCIDELKNLFIFTGVEPPPLLNQSSNPLQIYDKLHFLMSVVGVKSNVP